MRWMHRIAKDAAVPSPVDFNGLGSDNVVRRDRTTAIKETDSTANQMAAKRNTLLTEHQEGRSRERLLAELGLSSILPNANTAQTFAKGGIGELDLTESLDVVRNASQAVQAGNLSGLEATLTAQAVALDAIFNEMARRAALNGCVANFPGGRDRVVHPGLLYAASE